MTIFPSLHEIRFMLQRLELSPCLRGYLASLAEKSDKSVTVDVADQLRDLCADRLGTHGFDGDYDLTEEGKDLEKLIDKLFVG